jgi:hypothetical protein
MSVRRTQREVDSREFSEWIAFYLLENEMNDPEHEPAPDELGEKLAAWAAMHNKRLEAR